MSERPVTTSHLQTAEIWRFGAALVMASGLFAGSPAPAAAHGERRDTSMTSIHLPAVEQHPNRGWFMTAGLDVRQSLHFQGPKGQRVDLGSPNGSRIVVVDSQDKTEEAEAKIGDVNHLPDLQVVYKSKPTLSKKMPEGYSVPVIGCHSGSGWPCEKFKSIQVGEEWRVNNKPFRVAQYISLDFRNWNDARGMYAPGTHPDFASGELFFRVFGGKHTLGFQRPDMLEGYEALVVTSCEAGYVGGEIGYKEKFAVLFEPVKP